MKNNLKIERLSENNFGYFIRLMEKLAEFEKLNPPDAKAMQRLKKDGLGSKPRYSAYLAKSNDKYIGYIIYFTAYSSFLALPTFYLEDLFVAEEHRGKGFGQMMLDFCIDKAKRMDCGRLDLNVLTWNERARKFYGKNRFECIDWKVYRLDLVKW